MRRFLVLVILLSANLLAVTNNIVPSVEAKNRTIGEKIYYGFKIKNIEVLPSFNLSFKDPSKNEDILVVTQSIKNRKRELSYRAEIIPFKTGAIVFPSFNILNNQINSVKVTINSVLKPKVTPNFIENYQPYQDYSDLLLIAVLILFGLAGYFFWQSLKKKIAEQKKILTPVQKLEIWQELITIFSQERPAELKKYYFQSSERLKYFVEKILFINIIDLTVREIKDLLAKKELPEKQALLDTLELAEPVKFAKYLPSEEEFKNYQSLARQFLNANRPVEEVQNV
jgi:hypothetical protein